VSDLFGFVDTVVLLCHWTFSSEEVKNHPCSFYSILKATINDGPYAVSTSSLTV
jgi:hypothetical protein